GGEGGSIRSSRCSSAIVGSFLSSARSSGELGPGAHGHRALGGHRPQLERATIGGPAPAQLEGGGVEERRAGLGLVGGEGAPAGVVAGEVDQERGGERAVDYQT